jgi:hypothetical protein
LAIETTYGEIGTTDRLDPRRGAGLILVVGDDEVRWGIRPRVRGSTKPIKELRATLNNAEHPPR